MATTVQMNTRIDKSLKTAGDAVLQRYGYSPSSAVQALWNFVVEQNALPEFMPAKDTSKAKEQRAKEIEASAGIALRMFQELTGLDGLSPEVANLSDRELKELGWAERGAFDE